jgi:spermidine/putrescine transport system ATP-binding protein
VTPSAAQSPPVLSFRGVWKRFGPVVAARELELDVLEGEFLSFLGPSGCGKTTSLRMIAGFEQPSEGDVFLMGERVNGVPAYRRPVNMVFQHYALFPHFDVADNVSYGLRQRRPRPNAGEVARRVDEMLARVRLGGYSRRKVWELSGGQQQRVALARALINEPRVLLLDEPLAALDRKLRREMQIELQNLQRDLGITFVLVTHDQEEALSMSDRVCIMRDGTIVQVGTPRELYDRPLNRYVADFVGKSNFFDGVLSGADGGHVEVALDGGVRVPAARGAPATHGQRVSLSVRPEQMVLARDARNLPVDSAVRLRARVLNRIFLGEHTEYLLVEDRLGEFLALAPRQVEINESPFETGETVHVSWGADAALVLVDG